MSRKRVLVASAKPEALAAALEPEGYQLILARSFDEAAAAAETGLDLVLLDKALSDRDGRQAARDLKTLGGRLPPVMLVCAASEVEAMLANGPRPVSDILVEGFGAGELKLRVRAQLEVHGVDREVFQMRDSFQDMLMYDLRAPLASITVGLEYLNSDESLPGGHRKVLETLNQNCFDLESALQNFLDLERRDDEGFRLMKTEIDPRRILSKSVVVLKPALEARRVRLEFEGAARTFQGDDRWIRRLISGLALSAGKLSAAEETVFLRCANDGEAVRFSVSYRGQAIPAEARERIFDRYFHREKGGWIFPRGVGLALALARKIADAHLGRIWFESPGEGEGTFCVVLPPG